MSDYIVYSDGGARGNPGPAGYGAYICDGQGNPLIEAAGYIDHTTNNVAEYNGLILALETVASLDDAPMVLVRADSRLVVNQMQGNWKIKDRNIAQLVAKAQSIIHPMMVSYEWVPRERNKDADRLANEAMDTKGPIFRKIG